MPLFQLNELRQELRTKSFSFRDQTRETLDEFATRRLNEQAERFDQGISFDIFLSHSFKDAAAVLRLAQKFDDTGYSVYVDWIVDPQLERNKVDPTTAALIRERMRSCRCVLLALTSNARQSSWVQWELGLVMVRTMGKSRLFLC